MSLQFILGNSGCGKSEYIYKQIVEEASLNQKKDYLVIVPEQFTMQTQKKLVELSENGAIMNVDVLSFKRLAYRIFDELGVKSTDILEETGKNLVLRKIAQEYEEKLTVLRPNINRIGYISELKSLLSELVQYNVSPEQLKGLIDKEQLAPQLEAKLRDVLTMYEAFNEFMKDRYITAEELLNVLKDIAGESEILRDSVIVFDEFTGFTPIQNQLIKELLTIVHKIYVTYTIDAREDFMHERGMHELFYMPKKSMKVLMDIANAVHVEIEEPVVLGGDKNYRLQNNEQLFFMEQNLFRRKTKKYGKSSDSVEICNCKSPREEMVNSARKINYLVQEEGYRYKDIAVVTGDVNTYGNYVDGIFKKYEIPYFLDRTSEILFHPFIEFIRAIIEVIKKDFSYEAVFRFLRCGFCKLTDEQIDILENYVIATGVKGYRRWQKRWVKLPRQKSVYDLESLNSIREEILDILRDVKQVFEQKESTVRDCVLAIYRVIITLGIERQLYEKQIAFEEAGEAVKAKEYKQIYQIVMDLFDKFVSVLGDEPLSTEEFAEILDAGFDAAEVASIPPGNDNVIVGDIERTRLNEVKVIIFVGVNDGIVPKAANQGGIISQYEREALKLMELELAPGAREQTFIQRYYLYLSMTKPSDKLYVSYSRTDAQGKTSQPSYLIGVLKRLFPQIKDKSIEDTGCIIDVSTKEAAKDYILFGENDEKWAALVKYFLQQDDKEISRILDAGYIKYSDNPISKEIAKAIYGKQIKGSVTRLEAFARCAYSHFLKYGLDIREREENGFKAVDMGNIYHEALKNYSLKLENSDDNWFNISDEKRDEMARNSLREAALSFENADSLEEASSRHMIDRMERVFEETIWALTEQVRRGDFVPNKFEISFDSITDSKQLMFNLENGATINLVGRIDRVDTVADEGRMYVKVIDYKSGKKNFNLMEFYQGTQLQLVIYMNAAMELSQKERPSLSTKPGGILYYHIDEPVIEVENNLSEEEIRGEILKKLKPDGLVNSEEEIYRAMDRDFESKSDVIPVELKKDGQLSARSKVATQEEFEILSEYASTKIKSLGKEIFDGVVSVNPYESNTGSSCDYCPYESICAKSSGISGSCSRKVRRLSEEEIYENMRTENAIQRGKKE